MQNNKINHIAFIMDGNGRWATSKNLTRTQGHLEGAKKISKIILSCQKNNINEISFFAFSTENWNRPKSEVAFLIKLLKKYLNKKNLKWFIENDVRINFKGINDKNTQHIIKDIKEFCNNTKDHKTQVNICFNYGAQDEIIHAIKSLIKSKKTINKSNFEKELLISTPVDLLIRTSGEKRISNFLLWQIAYAEIIFEPCYWPDYNEDILERNLKDYYNRDRRFGTIK